MTEKKTPKIEFAPGCFDNFEGTQEELDALMKEITDMFESGEFMKHSVPLDEVLDDLTEDELRQLVDEVREEIGEDFDVMPQTTGSGKRILH